MADIDIPALVERLTILADKMTADERRATERMIQDGWNVDADSLEANPTVALLRDAASALTSLSAQLARQQAGADGEDCPARSPREGCPGRARDRLTETLNALDAASKEQET